MFVQFSRALALRVPIFAAISHYFSSRHVRQKLRHPGTHACSFHSLFHNSGHMSYLNSYARMLLGSQSDVVLREQKAKWVFCPPATQKVRVEQSHAPHAWQEGGMPVERGMFVTLKGRAPQPV